MSEEIKNPAAEAAEEHTAPAEPAAEVAAEEAEAQTAPAAERNALQSYVGMVNNMLANLPAAKAAVKK